MSNRALFWIGGILAIVVILVYWHMLPSVSESSPETQTPSIFVQ